MDMKATTAIGGPMLLVGNVAKVANLLKSSITLQNRRDEFFPRSATFVHTTPFGCAVQLLITPTFGSLKLDAKPALRTDLIE
jgi:hypothetical protein